jgi:TPR repeat protein
MAERSLLLAVAFLTATLSACAEQRYDPTAAGLPRDVNAKPSAEELASAPCKFGDQTLCIAACQSGKDPHSCNLLGVMLEYDLRGHDDPARASGFYRRGCDFSYYPACNNLAWLYLGGHGVPQDQAQAMRLFRSAYESAREACRMGDSAACMMAGEFRYEGRGVERDEAEATALLERACAGGQRHGCELLSQIR